MSFIVQLAAALVVLTAVLVWLDHIAQRRAADPVRAAAARRSP